MIPLVVIRPEPGRSASVAAARALGLEAVGAPLFVIEPQAWDAPDRDEFDALLVGSANVFRHGGAGLARYSGLPVHVVGAATAAAARAAGFAVGTVGSGGLQRVLDALDNRPGPGRLLRLAGAKRIALTPPEGVTMTERTVYASRALPMATGLAQRLAAPHVVALHSAEAARHFAAECDRLGVDRRHIALAVIGPRVASAAGGGWRATGVADNPDETALLAKARELCQTCRGD